MPQIVGPPALPGVRYLSRVAAARYVRETYGFPCSPRWLAKLAVVGGGPPYHKAGRSPVYAPEALDAWALARIEGSGTTSPGQAKDCAGADHVELARSADHPRSGS